MDRRILMWALVGYLSLPGAASGQPQTTPRTEVHVDVIGATPLPGIELRLEDIPSPVQLATDQDILRSGALDLADFLNRRMNGVYINDVQGNPFQPDLNYRGYTASPLLGTPQGLSVFMDGVRLNQPFGEIVSWDLIPRLAIATTILMPGSNPLFGLNTLGGAIAIQTKSGRTNPGTTAEATFGSAKRRMVTFENGGARPGGIDWYLTGNLYADDGWRERSPSGVRQLFGKVGWQNAKTDVTMSGAYANTSLTGNGLQDFRFLEQNYASVYTSPDTTDNQSVLFNVAYKHSPRNGLLYSGNAYYRNIHTDTFNGDINEDSLDQSLYQPNAAERAALAAAGYTGFPTSGENASNTPFPFWRCIGNALLRDEPAQTCNGLLNSTGTVQHNAGVSGQVTLTGKARVDHQFTAGAALDGSGVTFQQSTELGYLNPDRTVTGVGAFGDGVTGGSVDGDPYDTRVDLEGRILTWSLYATDTMAMGPHWRVTLSGRFNRESIRNGDRIQPGGGPGSLDSDQAFGRFNPAAGVTFSPSRRVNLYAGYSEGNRAPTSIELGCADLNQPCKLPNAMAGDPPLDQVVTRTFEAGARGGASDGKTFSWNAGMFIAANHQDILFVSSSQTGFGYFKNFGATRRAGVEAGASGRVGRARVGAGYTFLAATYQSAETVDGSSNSTNDTAQSGARGLQGTIDIDPGDRIPMIPRHTVKAYADVDVTTRLMLDLNVIAASSSYARGNENNQHQPDGTHYFGAGTSPGYGIVNVEGQYRIVRWLEIVAQLNNVFDTRYYTAAQLGPSGFTPQGNFIARPLPAVNGEFPIQHTTFYTPGAPRLFWVGTRFKF
jgi:outer membrane receptor protein involved in Fe transport